MGSKAWMGAVAACASGLIGCAARSAAPLHVPPHESTPIEAVVVGGGPHADSNQASIESNVRYVGALLPPESRRTVLFADGSLEHQSVRYLTPVKSAPGDQLLALLLDPGPGDELGPPPTERPTLPECSTAPRASATSSGS